MDFLAPVQFIGAWFAGLSSVHFDLFAGATLVGTSSTLATTVTPTFLGTSYVGNDVTRVIVTGDGPRWIMDDVQFKSNAVTTTPEPSSILLMAAGILATAVAARRRKRNA